ncbi:hypothetical protein UQW22_10040 [Isoptericola halotolerans]|uniref:hypothetical protein n=1 Tax=Isoptericola halotolerans TaxID=300560 RepID=UPI003891082B
MTTLSPAVELHDAWCSDPCEPSVLGGFAHRVADLDRIPVPDPACEGVSNDDVAAEPTPEWDAVVAQLGDPTAVAA